jgi:Spy/CpxP family protein refolding chaperone
MSRTRLGPIALLLATFVLGGLLGGAATSLADRTTHRHDRRPSFVDRLNNELVLTATQRDSVQAVLDRHQPAMDSLWQRMRPQFEAERQAIRTEITALLTPEQRVKYAALIQRLDSLRRAASDRNRNGHP